MTTRRRYEEAAIRVIDKKLNPVPLRRRVLMLVLVAAVLTAANALVIVVTLLA